MTDEQPPFEQLTERCPECWGSGCVDAISERDRIHPDMTGPNGKPLMPCELCDATGEILGERRWTR